VSRSLPYAASVRIARVALLAMLALITSTATARADFGPPALLSGTSQLEFEEAGEPAISEDGAYVVFKGRLAGVPGIYRRNLQSGAVQLVAGGEAADPANVCGATPLQPLVACDASGPSVSADGRYVAFTSAAQLVPICGGSSATYTGCEPEADLGCPQVYVRDMGAPEHETNADEREAYVLASALNDTGEAITFSGCPSEGAGARAAPSVALSAGDQDVVFTVLSESNLARGPKCEPTAPLGDCPPETPANQVVVRNLQAHTTTLMSVTPEGLPTPGGGAWPSATAAISADASTVAWLGADVGEQVPGAKEEIENGLSAPAGRTAEGGEAEPLWRRVAAGPGTATRRLLGGAGINLFFSRDLQEQLLGGSFVDGYTAGLSNPLAISANGDTVALLSNAPPQPAEASARLIENPPNTDAYVVQVEADPSTPPRVTALTATPDYVPPFSPSTENIQNIAISPDGSRVAFDTARTQFVLPTLTEISPPPAFTGTAETYEANLENGTLQRVSVTYDEAEPNGPAELLALSANGTRIVFASRATNLFYGDAIGASEVYLAEEVPAGAQSGTQELGGAPSLAPPAPEWLLSATASAQPDGSVLVDAQVPGAGKLGVQVSAQLPTSAGGTRTKGAQAKRRATRATDAKAKPPERDKAGSSAGGHPELVSRTVARTGALATVAEEVQLRAHVNAVYRALLATRKGLYVLVRVTFAAAGHRTLTREIPVTLRRSMHAMKKAPRKLRAAT
jgi:hypothetical protein